MKSRPSGRIFRRLNREALFLDSARVAIDTGEIGIFRIDVKEIVTLEIDLLKLFAVALREDQMAGTAVTGLD